MMSARVAIVLVALAAEAAADPTSSAAPPPLPPHLEGPREVELAAGAELDLPAGMRLYEAAAAKEIVRKHGGDPAQLIALIEPTQGHWVVGIEYDDVGYVEDDDAEQLDANELLESYQDGTQQQNAQRKAVGAKPLYVDAWSEPPRYLRAQHELVWGLAGHDADGKFINFFTRILGRNGYLSVDLIDVPDRIEVAKREALPVLQGLHYKPGARYEDHASGDRLSGLGLRGLVLGGAGVAVAAKLGILAKLLLVLKKGFIVIGAVFAGLFRWVFRRKKRADGAVTDHGPKS